MSDTELDIGRFPHDPLMPKGDILIDIFSRLTAMSDALHDPNGLLQTSFRARDDIDTRRHIAQMAMLHKILNEVLEVKARVDAVEGTIETHDAELTLMRHSSPEIQ